MSELHTPRFRWKRLCGLLTIAIGLCAVVLFAEMGIQRYEEWRASSKALAFLRESDPQIRLEVVNVEPMSGHRDSWKVRFRVPDNDNDEFPVGAVVEIDRFGVCTGHYHGWKY